MDYNLCLQGVQNKQTFSKQDLKDSFRAAGYTLGDTAFTVELQKMVTGNYIVREKKNVYSLRTDKTFYRHIYSDEAIELATLLHNRFKGMKFTIFELEQLNRFVNHIIAQNVIYLYVEKDLIPYVFDFLYDKYIGHILLDPTNKEYRLYWNSNLIIVLPLITQYPADKMVYWHESLEKYLVDIVAERIIRSSFADGEYPRIFEQAFRFYQLNTASMMRYAKRRHADEKIKAILKATRISKEIAV